MLTVSSLFREYVNQIRIEHNRPGYLPAPNSSNKSRGRLDTPHRMYRNNKRTEQSEYSWSMAGRMMVVLFETPYGPTWPPSYNRVFHSWDFGSTWAPTSASNLTQVGTQVGAQNRSWMSSRAQEFDLTSKLANLGPNLELRLTAPVSHQSGYVTPDSRIRDKISCLVVHSKLSNLDPLGPPTWTKLRAKLEAKLDPKIQP
jgi:hypothetical protein